MSDVSVLTPSVAVNDRKDDGKVAKMLNILAPGSLARGWPRAWERLTYTDRGFNETIGEGFDNPAAEMAHFGDISVELTIGGDWTKGTLDLETAWMRLRDNGPGIELERLEQCLALGELSKTNKPYESLHEHGVGMKTMLLMFCKHADSLRHIVTKTKNESHGYRFSYYDHENPSRPFGEIPVRYDNEIFAENEHGTEFYIVGLSEKGIYRRRQDYTTHVIAQLGFKYARLLSGDTFHGHKLSLRLRLCNKDGSPLLNKDGEVDCVWDIQPVVQRYRNADRPTVDQEKYSGTGPDGKKYAAILEFGRAAQDEEYATAGIEGPKSRHPCHQYNRRIHVVMHGKVITSLDIAAFGGNNSSNTYVPYTGVLTLLNGFSTTYEKNGIVDDGNWQELRERIYSRVQKLISDWAVDTNKDGKDKTELEKVYRDRYAARLRTPIPGSGKNPVVHTEYPVEGSGGKADVFYYSDAADATGCVIELKPDSADGKDVMQTFGYIFMSSNANKKYGQLVAEDFSTGARETARRVKNDLGVEIVLYTLRELKLDNDSYYI
jgi:hypothetical protein